MASPQDDILTQFGLAALIPGAQHMLDRMQAELDRMRAHLAALQNGAVSAPARRRGRPPTSAHPASAQLNVKGRPLAPNSGWPADAAARRREMKRRRQVTQAKRAAADSAEQRMRARMSAAAKARWAKMTRAERRERLDKMAAGKQAKPAVKLVKEVA